VGQKPSWRSVAGRPERDTLDATQAELRDETLRRNGCSAGRACLARCNSLAPFAARWESAEGRLKGYDFLLQAQTDATIGTMPRQKQRPPNPKGPDPRDAQTRWLLFVIAILFGLLVSQLAKRLM
jgi:hypothetical protein